MVIDEVPLDDVKVGVWYATTGTKVIGSVFSPPKPLIHTSMLRTFWYHL